ncbi:MAG TPA: CrcB family protein [Bryobacteraceae bacterium]|nr:CrcB family protein [Bryobacteraceae bacterium]
MLIVAAGGAVGSALRYGTAVVWGARPLTTFGVNVSGAFLIGVLAALTTDPRLRLLLGTGLLGGYTTFSAWQLEALLSAREGDWIAMAGILLGSTVAGLAAVSLGFAAGLRLR